MIATQLAKLTFSLHQAAQACGRDPAQIRLLAVSKFHPRDAVDEALAAGHRLFGENRLQEAESKFASHPLRAEIELHLIGPLQTNKVKQALALFDVIETVDRPALVQAIAKALAASGRAQPRLFVQVNTGREAQKSGVWPEHLPDLLTCCREHGLTISGLMAIPPVHDNPEPHFRLLVALAQRHGLNELSMGMSSDFSTAIACGATYIRIGSALFGPRPATAPATA